MNDQRKMPPERESVTVKLVIGNLKVYATVGLREDGSPGELFLKADKQGSVERGLMHALALMVSTAWQYGVPLEKTIDKLEHLNFEPSGFTGRNDVPLASSILDLLAKWLKVRFCNA